MAAAIIAHRNGGGSIKARSEKHRRHQRKRGAYISEKKSNINRAWHIGVMASTAAWRVIGISKASAWHQRKRHEKQRGEAAWRKHENSKQHQQ